MGTHEGHGWGDFRRIRRHFPSESSPTGPQGPVSSTSITSFSAAALEASLEAPLFFRGIAKVPADPGYDENSVNKHRMGVHQLNNPVPIDDPFRPRSGESATDVRRRIHELERQQFVQDENGVACSMSPARCQSVRRVDGRQGVDARAERPCAWSRRPHMRADPERTCEGGANRCISARKSNRVESGILEREEGFAAEHS
ncbi:hypothetical protein DFH09DRAFT_1083235 [Mycena vulgaris]|nr:hypothetical protein DFH09DRAFT_1083235 [Mycena vulgaris]